MSAEAETHGQKTEGKRKAKDADQRMSRRQLRLTVGFLLSAFVCLRAFCLLPLPFPLPFLTSPALPDIPSVAEAPVPVLRLHLDAAILAVHGRLVA